MVRVLKHFSDVSFKLLLLFMEIKISFCKRVQKVNHIDHRARGRVTNATRVHVSRLQIFLAFDLAVSRYDGKITTKGLKILNETRVCPQHVSLEYWAMKGSLSTRHEIPVLKDPVNGKYTNVV